MLAIDAGNTRVKWGVFDASGTLLAQGSLEHALLNQLTAVINTWPDCRRMVVSNVAGNAVLSQLIAMAQAASLSVSVIEAAASACGVQNRYEVPVQLGPDRWASLVAAWHRAPSSCVVVTAGTALTVDALSSQGEFLGGVIVPGWQMMRAALVAGTAGLSPQAGAWAAFPQNTADAMHTGCLSAMAGAVDRVYRTLQEREGASPRCLLAGGDAALLQPLLSMPLEIADNLVLQGLWLIEREHA